MSGGGNGPERGHWRAERSKEIRDELADHVERRVRSLIASGMTESEARVEAERRLGDVRRIEEECMRIARRQRTRLRLRRWIMDAGTDIRFSVRGMSRRPGLSGAIVLTVGLAIGVATSVFSVVNGVLLRPLPYPSDEELYSVYTRYLPPTGYDFEYFTISGPELLDYREMTRAMTGVAGYGVTSANLATAGAEPERVGTITATWDFFDVLEVQPVLGRGFTEADGRPGAECVAVLSDGLWRERFAADAGVIGRDIRYDGQPCRVIGVMPRSFVFADETFRLFVTMPLDPAGPGWFRESHPFVAIARLAPGSTQSSAQAEVDALRAQWSAAFPDHYARGHFIVLLPFREDLVGDTRSALLVLLGAVGVVLLLVSANLAGLVLSGAESRRREFAVRAALGVGRGRLLRMVLTDSLVLGVAGGLLGVLLSGAMLRGILALYPGRLPAESGIALDARVLAFGIGASIVCALLFGAAPALQTSALGSAESLRSIGRGMTTGRGGIRLRRGFVIAQTAFALVLAVGAGLLARSYAQLREVDLGFDPDDVLTFGISAPSASYPEPAAARAFFERVVERMSGLPGLRAAGAFTALPLEQSGGMDDFMIAGRPEPTPGDPVPNAGYQMATPGALPALGLRLVEGRWIEDVDIPGRQPVAVINETTRRRYFPDGAVGQRISYPADPDLEITVVGVVADTRGRGVRAEGPPAIYTALAQAPRPAYTGRTMNIALRFGRDPLRSVPAVRAALFELDPSLPPSRLRTLDQVVDESLGQPRFTMLLMSGFAVMALVLGALGVYGVLAHVVNLRQSEIGIRITLGARPHEVLRMIVRQGMVLTSIGIAIGLAAAILFRSSIAGLVFGIDAFDPASLAGAATILAIVSLLACAIPAWRAARLDPATAMRAQ